jgi:hypothetical protein
MASLNIYLIFQGVNKNLKKNQKKRLRYGAMIPVEKKGASLWGNDTGRKKR